MDSLNAKAREEKKEELIALKRDLERKYGDAQESLQRQNNAIVRELIAEMREIVNEVGEREGFTMIVEKGAGQTVLYADKQIDLTELIVREFNKKSK